MLWLTILIALVGNHESTCMNINFLQSLGQINSQKRFLNFYTQQPPSYMVIRLVPTLQLSANNCTLGSIVRYRNAIKELIQPMDENLRWLSSNLIPQRRGKRFAGVAVGLAALGVAVAAQATAAVALVEARANAEKIASMSQSIQETNKAVTSLSQAVSASGIAIQAIQNEINNVIHPILNQVQCDVLDARVGNILNLYLIKVTTIFQNQLTNPALQRLSTQALSMLMQSTSSYLRNLSSSESAINADLSMTNLIEAQIVGINMTNLQLVLAVFIPSIARLNGALLYDFISITISSNQTEVMLQIPHRVLEIGNSLYTFEGTQCEMTKLNAYCLYSDAIPVTESLRDCMNGLFSQCGFVRIIGSFANRFASVNGVIYANCKHLTCSCLQPDEIITQDTNVPLTIIDTKRCTKISLGHLTFTIREYANVTYSLRTEIANSQITVVSPLDLSSQLTTINNSLADATNHIMNSDRILDRLNSGLYSKWVIIFLICASIVSLIGLVFLGFLIRGLILELRSKHRSNLNKASTYSIDSSIGLT
ncbi:fusion protein [Tuhoko virus 3]|uniref:Fusion glycoprotein F0 n=1 Tax=Tuhoko virus 3 TaxID=798074 RepID=D8WJ40_9MONO|nr:fusion protein [Tuhoko virus 3]ADI80727.1 fusion protein [Tuhoko virus 3]